MLRFGVYLGLRTSGFRVSGFEVWGLGSRTSGFLV